MHSGNRKCGKHDIDERLQGSSRLVGIQSEPSLDMENG